MVSEKKKQILEDVKRKIQEYPVLGILDMHKLPARQLYEIRNSIRGKAVIKMLKKKAIQLALSKSKKPRFDKLADYVRGEPALLFSKENPFRLARILESSKSYAAAKPGDIAPTDIVVKAGPTNLPPGPVIGELQRAKIPAGVEGEKITVKEDTVVAKKGDVIDKAVADVLAKLKIEPIEISLNLLAAWEEGMIYPKSILFVPKEKYIEDIRLAYANALNLSININYFTTENIQLLLAKAHAEADALNKKLE